VWAVGCIFAEIMLGRPVFMARENSELFYEISKVKSIIFLRFLEHHLDKISQTCKLILK
jgi:hypothetical protein